MIAYAACVADRTVFERCARRGLRRAMVEGDQFAEVTSETSIHEAYNEVLDHFSAYSDLEALVLLHEDTEIRSHDFADRLKAVFADPTVALTGPIGARNVTSIAWWEGEMIGTVAWPGGRFRGDGFGAVDALDGLLLAFSPWAVRNIRCDSDRYTGFHGYDADLCFSARARSRRVVAADLPTFHHSRGGYGDRRVWDLADRAFRQKWFTAAACPGSAKLGDTTPDGASESAAPIERCVKPSESVLP